MFFSLNTLQRSAALQAFFMLAFSCGILVAMVTTLGADQRPNVVGDQRRCAGSESGEANHEWLTQNCSHCHSVDDPSGGFDVSKLGVDLDDPKSAHQWVRLQDRVRLGEMPPESEPLNDAERDAFLKQASRWSTETETKKFESFGRVRGRRR